MKMKFYLLSFLILVGLMSCQKEESFTPEDVQNPLSDVTLITNSEELVSLDTLSEFTPFHLPLTTIYGPFTGEISGGTPKTMSRGLDMSKSFEISFHATWRSIVFNYGTAVILHNGIFSTDNTQQNIHMLYRPATNMITMQIEQTPIYYGNEQAVGVFNKKICFVCKYNASTKQLLMSVDGRLVLHENFRVSQVATKLMLGGHPKWSNGSCRVLIEDLVIKN